MAYTEAIGAKGVTVAEVRKMYKKLPTEDFDFELDDGSTVTKKMLVLKSTTTAASA